MYTMLIAMLPANSKTARPLCIGRRYWFVG